MPTIRLLTKEMSELIAAGEVIERPCSVIKELIENAMDSGATAVTIEIKNGGISYMRITDNGCGIAEGEVPTAFLRHATSKIASRADLENILTLGFRGEALASICAVAKVDVLTKQEAKEYGTHYVIEGGEEKLSEACGCQNGTTIVIRDIFYNVPARLKFLKRDVTEGNSIATIVEKCALSHPHISIKFIRDNKQEIFTPGDGELFSTVYAVFGRTFAQSLLPVDYSANHIAVSGFIVKPLFAKANRAFENFFINSRYVKSVTCTMSLEEAYRNSLMTGKFPACILNISMPPDAVDVNVHPAKIEVRFSNEKQIFDSVYFAVKNALLTGDAPMELQIPAQKNPPPLPARSMPAMPVTPISAPIAATPTFIEPAPIGQLSFRSGQKSYAIEPTLEEMARDDAAEAQYFKHINASSLEKKTVEAPAGSENPPIKMRIIGEAFLNYAIVEVEDELLIIDKHAAHERAIFEQLKDSDAGQDSQMLLAPVEVLLTREEVDAILSSADTVANLGFCVEQSLHGLRVLGMPVYLEGLGAEEILPEIAENLLQNKQSPQSERMDELYHSVACKAAIKANDKTNPAELLALAAKIYGDERIKYCPHGRPVMMTITKKQLEKQFKRI